jgi:putative SOS response-associated peptidase YedK
MPTMPPDPDIAPDHDRQITILNREEWVLGSIRRCQRGRL